MEASGEILVKNKPILGAGVRTGGQPSPLDDPQYCSILQQFNVWYPENCFGLSAYDPVACDLLLGVAQGREVRGGNLIWHAYGKDLEAQFSHLARMLTVYPQIYGWNIANEIFKDDGKLRDNYATTDLILRAYDYARQLSSAKLFYSDYRLAFRSNRKWEAIYQLCDRLKREGLIDGVGIQFHRHLCRVDYFPYPFVEGQIRGLSELGLEIEFSEVNVWIWQGKSAGCGDRSARLRMQGEYYRKLYQLAERVGATKLIIWSPSDRYPFCPRNFCPNRTRKPADEPGLWDANYQPKPALRVIREAMNLDVRSPTAL